VYSVPLSFLPAPGQGPRGLQRIVREKSPSVLSCCTRSVLHPTGHSSQPKGGRAGWARKLTSAPCCPEQGWPRVGHTPRAHPAGQRLRAPGSRPGLRVLGTRKGLSPRSRAGGQRSPRRGAPRAGRRGRRGPGDTGARGWRGRGPQRGGRTHPRGPSSSSPACRPACPGTTRPSSSWGLSGWASAARRTWAERGPPCAATARWPGSGPEGAAPPPSPPPPARPAPGREGRRWAAARVLPGIKQSHRCVMTIVGVYQEPGAGLGVRHRQA
jgi:hypothetical protein